MPTHHYLTRALPWIAAALALASPAAQAAAPAASAPAPAAAPAGVLRLQSANSFDETVARLKADVAAKGIRLFDQIDQAALGAQANLPVQRSTLIIFGNPPLGIQFLQSSPYAGLDWPVRMLVFEDAEHRVWVSWTSFDTIAARYGITDRAAQIQMAGSVAASIAAAAAGK